MGLILHPQRRGIESLALHPAAVAPPFTTIDAILGAQVTDTDGNPLYPWGISEGIGPCADNHGEHVLVLGSQKSEMFYYTLKYPAGKVALAYSVLIRDPDNTELANDALAQAGISRRCAELLEPTGSPMADGRVTFHRTGHTALYTQLIT